jgi:hypothetical protein
MGVVHIIAVVFGDPLGAAQPGGLTWARLTALTADGCAGWSVCIYNPDLDPSLDGADAIISYITQAITASDQRAS